MAVRGSTVRAVAGLQIACVMFCMTSCPPAFAQSMAGRGRLGLEGGILRYQRATVDAGEVADGPRGPDRTVSALGLGLASAGAGLGFGVGLGNYVLLGAHLTFAFYDLSFNDGNPPQIKVTSLALDASPEFVLAGGPVRPYVAPLLGLEGQGISKTTFDDYSSLLFLLGARCGLYGFVNDGASIDPSVSFGYAVGDTGKLGTRGFRVLVALGISAWFGGHEEPEQPGPARRTEDAAQDE